MKKLTQKELKRLLHYDPETGIFVRLIATTNNIKIGDVPGYINKSGYRLIRINGKRYFASRLAHLYMEGYFPEHEIDHRDRDRSNDAWENLRHVNRVCNMRNQKIRNTNKSGITGVGWFKRDNKWRSRIMIFGKENHLGYYQNFIDAVKARWEAEKQYNWPNCNTTSPAFEFLKKEGQL